MFIDMARWRKGLKEYSVSVADRGDKGAQIQLPRPLYEHMGRPSKITFVLEGKRIMVKA